MHRYLISVCFFSPTTYYATDNVLGKHSDHFSKFILIFFFFLVTICIPYTSYMQMMSIASAFISEITLRKCWGFLKRFQYNMDEWTKKADCNGISYGWGFVYSFPRNCTLIICVLVRTIFCDYMQYLLIITTSHICILLSVYVSPCNIVPS